MKRYTIVIIMCLASLISRGQDETQVLINYMPSLSLGETADFTKNFSPRGIEFEVDRYISEDLSLGLAVGWNVFREKVTGESFEYNNYLVTGTQFRYTNIVPLNINAKKYFSMGGQTPFIGLGLGTSYARQTNDVGIFSLVDSKWQFNIAPEAGMRISLTGLLVSLKVKYSHSLKAGNFPAMSFLGFGIGVGLN